MENTPAEVLKQISGQYSGGIVADKSGLVINHFGSLPTSSAPSIAALAKNCARIHPDHKPLIAVAFDKQQIFVKEEIDVVNAFALTN